MKDFIKPQRKMDFTRTLVFQLVRVNVSDYVTHPDFRDILQQKWINNEGETEWRDVDLVIKDGKEGSQRT